MATLSRAAAHFGAPGDTWRPYVGICINYTKFVSIESTLASNVEMSDSWGPAAQIGIDYALNKDWRLFASVAALKVKSNLVATGATVLTTTIDLMPITYSLGVAYKI
jgi:outer membrane protein